MTPRKSRLCGTMAPAHGPTIRCLESVPLSSRSVGLPLRHCGTSPILFQISKALTGTDKKDLIRKLPKFIYDEEKASEVCLMIMVLKFKYRLQHTILSLYHATNWFYQKRRKALAEKIAQLNAAIDDVSSQLIPNDEPNGAAVASDEFEAAI
ncbi:hypothetical protein BHE74_00010758 [Ensete ventricosum]|nr:hypothetical protein BHE74_00010758 [Ensete ventricosum]